MVGQTLLIKPLPNVAKVFSLIIQEDKQREIGFVKSSMVDYVTLVSKKMTDYARINSKKQQKQPRKYRFLCTHCGMNNHIIDKCYKIPNFPHSFKQNSRQNGRFIATNKVSGQI